MGYAIADGSGDFDTPQSTTGYIFKPYGGAVGGESRRQPSEAQAGCLQHAGVDQQRSLLVSVPALDLN